MEKTNEKRNMLKRIMLMLCAAVVAISTVLGSGVTEVQAASKVQKAKAAYAKILYKAKPTFWETGGYYSFALLDINKDGMPELIMFDCDDSGAQTVFGVDIYTYFGDKAHLVKKVNMGASASIYPSKSIVLVVGKVGGGMYFGTYYRFNGKKMVNLAGYSTDGFEEKDVTYYIRGKNTTKKKYNQFVKKLHCKKSAKLKTYKNTDENRQKYLKSNGAPSGSIAINSKNFPDENFREYISFKFDEEKNGRKDGYLTSKERLNVKNIDIRNRSIQNLKGIEFFQNLEELHCSDTYLSTIDMSSNKKLKVLDCSEVEVREINVKDNPDLVELICSSTECENLDISNNPNLKILNCNFTKLSSLDVSHNPKLEELK